MNHEHRETLLLPTQAGQLRKQLATPRTIGLGAALAPARGTSRAREWCLMMRSQGVPRRGAQCEWRMCSPRGPMCLLQLQTRGLSTGLGREVLWHRREDSRAMETGTEMLQIAVVALEAATLCELMVTGDEWAHETAGVPLDSAHVLVA